MILFFISFCKQTNLKITVKHSSSMEMRFTVKRIISLYMTKSAPYFVRIISYHDICQRQSRRRRASRSIGFSVPPSMLVAGRSTL